MQFKNIYFLRFFFSFLVVLFHANGNMFIERQISFDYNIFRVGTNAVYGFFVISGFLMCTTQSKIQSKQFYIKRAKRILPLYYSVVILGISIYLIGGLLGVKELDVNYSALIYPVILLPQIIHLKHQEFLGFIEVLWSIGVEMIYYALFPKLAKLNRPITIFIFLVVSFIQTKTGGILLNYLNYFLLGHIISWLYGGLKSVFIARLLFLIGLSRYFAFSGVISANLYLNDAAETFFIYCLIMGAVHLPFNLDNFGLIRYLGNTSYALYISHFFSVLPVILVTKHFEVSLFSSMLMLILSSYALSHFFYRLDSIYQNKIKLL